MKFEEKEFPILDVIDEEMPEFRNEFMKLVADARNGGREEKFELAGVMRELVANPFAGIAASPALTKRVAMETIQTSFDLIEEGAAEGHLKSKILSAHFHAAGMPCPQDLPKARALCKEVRNDKALAQMEDAADDLAEVEDFIRRQERAKIQRPWGP